MACSLAVDCLANCDPKRCKKGRSIERSQYEQAVEANRKRVEQNRDLYRRRQAIVEHPFGTIKRAWGYTYTLLKRIRKVTGEFSLIYTAYNMRRSVSILTFTGLMDVLKSWKLDLEWVEKARFFLFSLQDALRRLTAPEKQSFRYPDVGFGQLHLAVYPAL